MIQLMRQQSLLKKRMKQKKMRMMDRSRLKGMMLRRKQIKKMFLCWVEHTTKTFLISTITIVHFLLRHILFVKCPALLRHSVSPKISSEPTLLFAILLIMKMFVSQSIISCGNYGQSARRISLFKRWWLEWLRKDLCWS